MIRQKRREGIYKKHKEGIKLNQEHVLLAKLMYA